MGTERLLVTAVGDGKEKAVFASLLPGNVAAGQRRITLQTPDSLEFQNVLH
jgi:hypothetical protein